MRYFLAMLFYVDYKCTTQPGFRKTFLVLTLIFVILLWSPWRPLLCPVLGVCPARVVLVHSVLQAQAQPRRVNLPKRIAPTQARVQIRAESPVQAGLRP